MHKGCTRDAQGNGAPAVPRSQEGIEAVASNGERRGVPQVATWLPLVYPAIRGSTSRGALITVGRCRVSMCCSRSGRRSTRDPSQRCFLEPTGGCPSAPPPRGPPPPPDGRTGCAPWLRRGGRSGPRSCPPTLCAFSCAEVSTYSAAHSWTRPRLRGEPHPTTDP